MARIVYRGAYATFPMVGLTAGDLALATDLNLLFEWSGAAWFPYDDFPDYQGDKSKLLTVADWAAVQATDIEFTAAMINAVFGNTAQVTYLVPAGRTLYITEYSFAIYATVAANADNEQHGGLMLEDITLGVQYLLQAGNGGGGLSLNKPIVTPGGNQFRMTVFCHANHACTIRADCGGYQI